jgi:hypothetical protein|tara:strand:- start:1370 stop:1603 length:234 start_codon:yes stop_codon:yes gene_type:complete
MENQEVLKAIATLADKVSRYHERLLAVERDNERLQKELLEHRNVPHIHTIQGKPHNSDATVMVTGLDSDMECEACGA